MVFGRMENEIKMKQFQLQILQNSISSIEDAKREKSLKLKIEDLLVREELMWAQKARTRWFLQGDRKLLGSKV